MSTNEILGIKDLVNRWINARVLRKILFEQPFPEKWKHLNQNRLRRRVYRIGKTIYSTLIRYFEVVLKSDFSMISGGAVLGANTRYWIENWAVQRFGNAFPFGNLIVNLSGSFLIGLLMTWMTGRFLVNPRWRVIIAIGFLGSYTTFSSFIFDSVSLLFQGHWAIALVNAVGSTVLGGGAVLLGIYLGQWL